MATSDLVPTSATATGAVIQSGYTGDYWTNTYPYWTPTYPYWWPVAPPWYSSPVACSVEHDYRKFDETRLFCRKCGDVKKAGR